MNKISNKQTVYIHLCLIKCSAYSLTINKLIFKFIFIQQKTKYFPNLVILQNYQLYA